MARNRLVISQKNPIATVKLRFVLVRSAKTHPEEVRQPGDVGDHFSDYSESCLISEAILRDLSCIKIGIETAQKCARFSIARQGMEMET
jgi:hypothetical protein